MKKIIVLAMGYLLSFPIIGQKVIEKNLDYNGQYITMEVPFASEIEVKTWDKSSIYFKATIATEDSKYFDLYQLDITNRSNSITITSDPEAIFDAMYDEWKTNNPNQKKKSYYHTNKDYEFDYVLYVPKNAVFKVSSINGHMKSEVIQGDFEADLINGNIDIKKYEGNLNLNTINGEIDLSVGNTYFTAETIHGEIYADENLELVVNDQHVGQKVQSKSRSSKNRLSLNTINGNMYLRL